MHPDHRQQPLAGAEHAARPSLIGTADVLGLVADHFALTAADLVGPSRAREITFARHMAMALLARTGHTRSEISRHFRRDRSTVLAAIRRVVREERIVAETRLSVAELDQRYRWAELGRRLQDTG